MRGDGGGNGNGRTRQTALEWWERAIEWGDGQGINVPMRDISIISVFVFWWAS